jgi:hypothetical protein
MMVKNGLIEQRHQQARLYREAIVHYKYSGRLIYLKAAQLPGQSLTHAAGRRLGRRGTLQHLGRGRGAAAAEKFHATLVPGVYVAFGKGLAREVFLRTGITARS